MFGKIIKMFNKMVGIIMDGFNKIKDLNNKKDSSKKQISVFFWCLEVVVLWSETKQNNKIKFSRIRSCLFTVYLWVLESSSHYQISV